ncbi:DUF4365 domain-containing protein [Nocardia sp. NPDC052001]|uniref:DUF4365 domain-containing protein n=1 Tax=Nocardia sp. NPDC052001 TaxID=3154853 RepID=UPI00343E2EE8
MTDSNHVERLGVYSVGCQITELGWVFREQSESDFGVDAHVEIVVDGMPTGQLIALQIKSGPTYFKESSAGGGWVVRGKKQHLSYWLDHQLPVLLVLYNPETGTSYWTHIDPTGREVDHRFTPNGFKIVVREAQRLDEGSKTLISRIAEQWIPRRNNEWSSLQRRLMRELSTGVSIAPSEQIWKGFTERVAGRSPLSARQLRQSVLVYNLPIVGESWTPKAAATSVPAQVSLDELRGRWSIRRDTTVFVCENPVVIDSAASKLGSDCLPLVCLHGYPNLAAEYLLLALGISQARIRVHTDHDLFGARIAQTLFHKLIDYEPWCPKPSAEFAGEGVPAARGTTEEECLPYILNDLRR